MRRALVLEFECLPAFVLGAYGCLRAGTPGFDHLAAESVCFERCFASEPARSSQSRTLQSLRESGITVSFEEVGSVPEPGARSSGNRGKRPLVGESTQVPADLLSEVRWLRHPGLPLEDAAKCLLATTPALRQLDELVEQVVVQLRAEESAEDWLLIVLGAAGVPPSRDPPTAGVAQSLLGETELHVPLIVRTGQTGREFGTRRQELVHTGCLADTIIQWIRGTCDGVGYELSLLPAVEGRELPERDSIVCRGAEGEWAIRTGDFLCVATFAGGRVGESGDGAPPIATPERPGISEFHSEVALFVKPDDLWDTLDVADQYPAETERLLGVLRASAQAATGSQGRP